MIRFWIYFKGRTNRTCGGPDMGCSRNNLIPVLAGATGRIKLLLTEIGEDSGKNKLGEVLRVQLLTC